MAALVLIGLLLNGAPDARRQADQLVQDATVDYNASDFEAALGKLTLAYKLRPDPALLFDIAQCHRALHHWERAEFTYKAYLSQRPDAHDRKKVKALIAKMHEEREREQSAAVEKSKAEVEEARAKEAEARAATAQAAKAPAPLAVAAPAAATEPPSVHAVVPHRKIPVAAWVLGGLGAAALLGGGYFAYADESQMGQNHPTRAPDGLPAYSITYGQFQAAQYNGAIAETFFVAGGALVLTAVVWALVSPSHRAPHVSEEAF